MAQVNELKTMNFSEQLMGPCLTLFSHFFSVSYEPPVLFSPRQGILFEDVPTKRTGQNAIFDLL